jgi:hypothetical protein
LERCNGDQPLPPGNGELCESKPIQPYQREPAKESPSVLSEAARRVSAGDVLGAREFLSKFHTLSVASASATDIASGAIAFALAETYDPNVLGAWGAKGVSANVVLAKKLYREAMERGQLAKAVDRLVALPATGVGAAQRAAEGPSSVPAAPAATASTQAVAPISTVPSALHATVEEGYRMRAGRG